MKLSNWLIVFNTSFFAFVCKALPFGLGNYYRSQSPKLYAGLNEVGTSVTTSSIMASQGDLIARIDTVLSQGHKICLITRGLPGRGKTTLAGCIVNHFNGKGAYKAIMVAADDFMMNSNGEYCWAQSKLHAAHSNCIHKLSTAMESGVHIVCQHNTNVRRKESTEISEKAHALGYLVLYIEPEYAWTESALIPPSMRNVLVNTHGVGEEKINEMRLKKQYIFPSFMAYWLRSSQILEQFASVGISTTDFYRTLNELASVDGSLNLDAFAGMKLNETKYASPGTYAARTVSKNDARLLSNESSRDRSTSVLLPETLHITTDYIGHDGELSYGHQTQLRKDILSNQSLKIVALFSDGRGVGALVTCADDSDQNTSESESEGNLKNPSESSKTTTQNWIEKNIRDAKDLPRYGQYRVIDEEYLRLNGLKKKVPHMTLRVHPGSQAMNIGEAAYEFQQLLLRNILTLENQSESESESSSFYPNIITLGDFKCVLFESPVLCHGTFSCSYLRKETPKKASPNKWSPSKWTPSPQPRKYGYR